MLESWTPLTYLTAEDWAFKGYFGSLVRWIWKDQISEVVLPKNMQFRYGIEVRDGDPRGLACAGRDSVACSRCCSDWKSGGGGREMVDATLAGTKLTSRTYLVLGAYKDNLPK